jgi:hypothetical protein
MGIHITGQSLPRCGYSRKRYLYRYGSLAKIGPVTCPKTGQSRSFSIAYAEDRGKIGLAGFHSQLFQNSYLPYCQ